MPENNLFLPEGLRPPVCYSLARLKAAAESGEILEAPAVRCDTDLTLHLDLGGIRGRISRSEAVAPWISGSHRDIAVLSRVGKETCFTVSELRADPRGAPLAILSRVSAQKRALEHFLQNLCPGSILACRVTRMEPYGAFLDIGCGITALLPLERISVSRISHPNQRFREGQKILAAVWQIDRDARRFTMTHRELLGTWMENAARFETGEAVRGIVRGVKEYGSFVELAPNLSAMVDTKAGLAPGDAVSVFIRAIRPEQMKIKLQMIEKLSPVSAPDALSYQITDGRLERWIYSPPHYEKAPVETDFTACGP